MPETPSDSHEPVLDPAAMPSQEQGDARADGHAKPQPFRIRVSQSAGTVRIVLSGQFNATHATELGRLVSTLSNDHSLHVAVDLRRLTFVDSADMSALLMLDRRIADLGKQITLERGINLGDQDGESPHFDGPEPDLP